MRGKPQGGNRRSAVVAALIGLLMLIPGGAAADHEDQFTSHCKDGGQSENPPRTGWVSARFDNEDHAGAGFDRRFDDGRGEGVLVCTRWAPGGSGSTNAGLLSSNQTNGVVIVVACQAGGSCTTALDHTGVTEGDVNTPGVAGVSHDGGEVWVDGERTPLQRREVSVNGELNEDPVKQAPGTICAFGECVPNVRVDTGLRLTVQESLVDVDQDRPMCVTTNNDKLPCEEDEPDSGDGPCAVGQCVPLSAPKP